MVSDVLSAILSLISVCTNLLTTKRVIGSDNLSHEHGGGNHDCSTCHRSRDELGNQLLTRWKPDENNMRKRDKNKK